MKKIKKVISIVLLLGICIFSSIGVNKVLIADSGFDSGYSSSSSSFSSSFSSSSSGSTLDGDGSDVLIFVVGFFIFVSFVIFIAAIKQQSNNNENDTGIRRAIDENEIKKYLPDFDRNKFLQETYKVYVDVQKAWESYDIDSVRNILTNEIYNMYSSQVETLKVKGERNVMSDFRMTSAKMVDFKVQNQTMEITNEMTIEFYDYIIDNTSGKVLRGTKDRKIVIDYEMTFVKSLTATKPSVCPNCGAKLDMNTSARCKYCNSTIVSENNSKWVLAKKKNLHQRFK